MVKSVAPRTTKPATTRGSTPATRPAAGKAAPRTVSPPVTPPLPQAAPYDDAAERKLLAQRVRTAVEQSSEYELPDVLKTELDRYRNNRPWAEWRLWVPPSIDPRTVKELEKRFELVGIPLGPEMSELLMDEGVDALLSPEQKFIRSRGRTPLEFLHAVYTNPFLPLHERKDAAKSLMEYAHDPRPKRISGVEGEPGLFGDAPVLQGFGQFVPERLTQKELAQFESLLRKACDAKVAKAQ